MRALWIPLCGTVLLSAVLTGCGAEPSQKEPGAAGTVAKTYAESNTAAFCSQLAERHLSAEIASYYQGKLTANVTFEVSGDQVHVRTEYQDSGQIAEVYFTTDGCYLMREGKRSLLTAENRYSAQADPEGKALCAYFFNTETAPADMQFVSAQEADGRITECFTNPDSGSDMVFVYDSKTGALISDSFGNSEQRFTAIQQTTGSIALPPG